MRDIGPFRSLLINFKKIIYIIYHILKFTWFNEQKISTTDEEKRDSSELFSNWNKNKKIKKIYFKYKSKYLKKSCDISRVLQWR